MTLRAGAIPLVIGFTVAAGSFGQTPVAREGAPGTQCPWVWTAPETLRYRGAPVSLGDLMDPPHVESLGKGLALVSSNVILYYRDVQRKDMLGVMLSNTGDVQPLARPAFMTSAGPGIWAAAALRGTMHVVWDSLGVPAGRVLYAFTDGTGWSARDRLFPSTFEMTEGHIAAAVGDDVITARPYADSRFSGIDVGVRVGGRWKLSRFSVQHPQMAELPLAVGMDEQGAVLAYFRPAPKVARSSADGKPGGLYLRRRTFDDAWGPETLVSAGLGHSPIVLTTADGAWHIFWRGLGADAPFLLHATKRNGKWVSDRIRLPTDIQTFDVATEADGVRIVMQQADSPNDMDETYSRILTLAWTSSGPGAIDTLAGARAEEPAITRISKDTLVMTWTGQQLVTQSTEHPNGGPSQGQSIVPVTIVSRHVRDATRCRATKDPERSER